MLVSAMGTGLVSVPGWRLLLRCPPGTAGLPAEPPQRSRQVPAASCLIVQAKTIALWLLCAELSPNTQGWQPGRGTVCPLGSSYCHHGSSGTGGGGDPVVMAKGGAAGGRMSPAASAGSKGGRAAGVWHCQRPHAEHQRGDSTGDWGGPGCVCVSWPGLPGQQVTIPCPSLAPGSASPSPWTLLLLQLRGSARSCPLGPWGLVAGAPRAGTLGAGAGRKPSGFVTSSCGCAQAVNQLL